MVLGHWRRMSQGALVGLALGAIAPGSPALAHDVPLGIHGCHTESELQEHHCHEGLLAGRAFPSREAALEALGDEIRKARRTGKLPAAPTGERLPNPVVTAPEHKEPQRPQKVARIANLPSFNPANIELPGTEVFQRVSPSVYIVLAYGNLQPVLNERPFKVGSAVAVTTHLALTNCHVLAGAARYVLFKEGRDMPARLYAAARGEDRCILRSNDILQPIASLRHHDELKVGERVFTVGSPNGLENTLGEGLLSGKRTLKNRDYLQTSAPISPGSSGGGLFDASGNLIGITTFIIKEAQNLNFAIPVAPFLESLNPPKEKR